MEICYCSTQVVPVTRHKTRLLEDSSDDDDFEVPSVLQAAANWYDEEEEDELHVASKTKVATSKNEVM
ncbi:hypothetical protein PsorP6_017487 [Peronosclerospora sorghi]|uniref:Uncharacterized protein n=1 Tax=Peronosclerospora sorghi TaxID=230839 RepID=A0ACC0WKM9_9STRA|nr:hypothetical protein PsorP6_017487 [Peronosclerospora sorghi]